MSRALNPIRQLYSVEPDPPPTESPPTPAEASEREALRPVREALDRLSPRSPEPALTDAVVALALRVRDEAEATRPLREALNALPPQRPEPSLTDAVVAMAMTVREDAQLAGVRALYEPESAAPQGRAAIEAAALRPVRDALDAMPKQRPKPSVIDAVVAAARPAVAASAATRSTATRSTAAAAAPDRGARRSSRRRVGTRTAIGSALVLMLAAALTLWPRQAVSPDATLAANAPTEANGSAGAMLDSAEAPESGPEPDAIEALPSDPIAEATPPPASSDASASAATPQAASPQAAPSLAASRSVSRSAPAVARSVSAAPADEDSDLRLLYLRLQDLEAAGMSWGAPPVELGSEAASTPAAAPARGWMQVRIEP